MGFFSDVSDAIFGSSSRIEERETKTELDTTQTTQTALRDIINKYETMGTLTPEQEQLLRQMIGYSGQYADKPSPGYEGPLSAKMSGLQGQGLIGLQSYAGGESQNIQDMLQRFVGGEYMGDEYYETAIRDPLVETWKEEIMPELRGEYGRRGLFYGSGREASELRSAETLMDTLGRARVEQQEVARGEMMTAGELSLQHALGLTGAQMEYGSFQQQREQEALQREYSEWLRTQPGYSAESAMNMQLLGVQPYTRPFQTGQTMLPYETTQITSAEQKGDQPIVIPGQSSSALGDIAMAIGTWQASSRRFKENIENIENSLDKITALQGVKFDWKENGKADVGLIAEDVDKVIPDVVLKYEDQVEGIYYQRIIPYLVEAVKEQQKQINELRD